MRWRSHTACALADALIGATALEDDLTLLTASTKHFSAVEGLEVEAFTP